MPSLQSTVILASALLGSLLQHAAAAPGAGSKRADVQFPDCISTCMRNSGCFDTQCICKKADGGILSDIVICMNQWCPADITAKDLIQPLEGQCDLSKSAVQDAEKKGGVLDDTSNEETSSAKPTATPTPSDKGSKGGNDEVTMTFDLGTPQTAPAETATAATTATTVKPAVSGTLTIPTDAATTGLLTDSDNESTTAVTGSLGAATSTPATATPSPSASTGNSTGSTDDEGNAAGLSSQSSIFGVVAAMGVALALGF
ncbi:hypothetical protein F4801DRAFT_13884 [Xylaria longipes]|nr:hypothetical protein F4801DRAFT_13884 [Xylaria longipes]RYC63933.1 hypothetical protein CHU98_g2268 [Xylaria longipes]